MRYGKLGKTDQTVSALGFGAMRLPTLDSPEVIDEPAAIELLRCAIDHGVNYVDTAYVYHGGKSEVVVGKALRQGYRSRVYVATKCPVWSVTRTADFDRYLDEQLARLQTDRIDFYLLHCLQKSTWPKVRDLGVLDWAERAQASGRIGEFGFSFHDSFDVFRDIVDAYDWGFCQIQYNFVCEDVQAGTQGLKYAGQRGLSVIVMEPLFGGSLANPPQPIWEIWQDAGHKPADVALRWVWDQPEVSLVLSGMSSLGQLQENLESANRSGVGWLDEQERKLVQVVQEKYRDLSPIACTKCGYCLPCPQGVNIPLNFELYNDATVYRGNSALLCRNLYHGLEESELRRSVRVVWYVRESLPAGNRDRRDARPDRAPL